jgi:hypothetical protein
MTSKTLKILLKTSIIIFLVSLTVMIVTIIIRSGMDYTEDVTLENLLVKYGSMVSFVSLIAIIVFGVILKRRK